MKNVSAVIGANFGDEGKGHMVDFLANSWRETIVVRYNGGAQAGHTVVLPDGRRHVFHHFGSGTLAQRPTYLSKFFLVNPIVFCDELAELRKLLAFKGEHIPQVWIDPEARVTTPWDMMVNQAIEKSRGRARHGSCGLGIHETVERHKTVPLTVADLYREDNNARIRQIKNDYYPTRLAELGLVDEVSPETHEGVLTRFLFDIKVFLRTVFQQSWDPKFVADYQQIIFEGAQGLRLDEDSPLFPHVTCSKTGLPNVVTLLKDAGLEKETLNAFYVTRPYITRHGAGPLRHEQKHPLPGVVDKTNIYNQWQGDLRFGNFDVREFAKYVRWDYEPVKEISVCPQIVLTCVDQMPEKVPFLTQEEMLAERPWHVLLHQAMQEAGMRDVYVTKGPTRNDVRRWP